MKKNINQILDIPHNIKIYFLSMLIILSFLLRLVTVYFIRDTHFDNEWNILLNNLINYKSYSFYTFDAQLIPSVYLPPIYPFFLYLVKLVTSLEGKSLINSIIFIQIILSTYSIYLFFQINQNFFSRKMSLISSTIFSIIPLNLYACGQISSINFQIVFALLFLKFFLLVIKKQEIKNLVALSIATSLLILTRGEFILIFLIIIFFCALCKKIKIINVFKIILIVLLLISPYVVRNYIHFKQIIIVKSIGYNLWKGNNEFSTVQGYENYKNKEFKNLNNSISELKKNKYYEINRDNIFLKEAKENLFKDPVRYTYLFLKKFISFYFIDINSTYPNYYNFFHFIPILIISILSIPGLLVFFKKKKFENNFIGIYLFLNLFIFSVFFILPRYKLAILPIQIIFALYFIQFILEKINLKKNI